jgi:hypothetical protein
MDEPNKAKIRKRARALITAADLLVLVSIVANVLLFLFAGAIRDSYSHLTLLDSHYGLKRAFWDYSDQKALEVGCFLPPERAAEYPGWAQHIHEHMGQPVAVFVRDERGTQWPFKSPEMAQFTRRYEERLATLDTARGWDTLGAIVWRYSGIVDKVDSLSCHGRLFWQVGEKRKWGMLYQRKDAWVPFFERLKAAETDTTFRHTDRLVDRVSTFLMVRPPRHWTPQPMLRAFFEGKQVYRSPGLDTTMISETDSCDAARLEFYVTRVDKMYERLADRSRFPWVRIGVLVIVMLVFHVCWVWIKKLTAPELPHG